MAINLFQNGDILDGARLKLLALLKRKFNYNTEIKIWLINQ